MAPRACGRRRAGSIAPELGKLFSPGPPVWPKRPERAGSRHPGPVCPWWGSRCREVGCDSLLPEETPPRDGPVQAWDWAGSRARQRRGTLPLHAPSEAKSEQVKAREPRASGGIQGGLWVAESSRAPRRASCWGSGEHFALVWMEWSPGLVQARAPGCSWAVNWDLGRDAPVCVESHWTP